MTIPEIRSEIRYLTAWVFIHSIYRGILGGVIICTLFIAMLMPLGWIQPCLAAVAIIAWALILDSGDRSEILDDRIINLMCDEYLLSPLEKK